VRDDQPPLPGKDDPAELPEVVGSRSVYQGRVVSLRVDEVRLGPGKPAIREVVEHPGAVVIAAIDDADHIYLVRQYRHPIRRDLLELPAGGLEFGEEPFDCAKRELREEVGLEAAEWTYLGAFFSSPGFANEKLHAFVARDLSPAYGTPDDDEDIEVVRYSLRALLGELDTIKDAKTLATLLLLARQSGLLST
jgi:ADP-ribose diphosphatase